MQMTSFTINLEKDFKNFNQFEERLITAVREQVCSQLVSILEVWDEELGIRLRQRYPQYRFKGFVRRKVRCFFGTFWVKMRRYCHPGWSDVYPLMFVLPHDGISAQLQDLMLELVTDVSYQRSERYLQKATGVRISPRTIWRIVQKLGQAARNLQEQSRCRIFEEGHDDYPQDDHPLASDLAEQPVYVELDGTMVGSREKGEDRFEIKSGIMYSQVVQTGKRRWRLMDKIVYSTSADGVTFGENFYAFCREHGLDLRHRIIFLSDGANWLQSVAENVFPEASKRLDLYHLKKAWSPVLNESEAQELATAVYQQSAEQIIARIQDICQQNNLSGEMVTDLMQYLLSNQKSINYPPGERHGSGGIEKNIGILVGRRFKRQGMSWSHEGVSNLLALRIKKLNQIWQQDSKALN